MTLNTASAQETFQLDVRMPTRWETLTRTARRLVLGRNDLELLAAASMSFATLVYSLATLLLRTVLFLTLPLSALLLYPAMRANHRRWFRWAQATEKRRRAMVAELSKVCSKPLDPWEGWIVGPSDTLNAPGDAGKNASGGA